MVGGALLRGGTVLAARRTRPVAAAGRWEFPGGKVEDRETPEQALVRELAEELGCTVAVTGWLGAEAPIGEDHVLRVALARIVAGEPDPTEHDRLRWVGAGELAELDWLEADRPFLPELRGVLERADASGAS